MSSYSEGQVHQLMNALEAKGFTAAELTRLGQYPKLSEFKAVLAGTAEIVITKHIIDCDANPFVPNNWKVEEHQKGGQLQWDADKVSPYLCDEQKTGSIVGAELRKKLKGKPVLNANVLDYLLANPHLIPEEWKGKFIFFWGTIYRNSDGNLYVRCLSWDGEQWDWDYFWLDDDFVSNLPAAVSK